MWTATIEFTTAFDSITHKSIWNALKSCGIEHDYISLMKKLYRDQKASGVLSRAIFRRPPVSGQKYFTVLSLRISNIYAKKKGIAKKLILTLRAIMISQEVD